MSKYVGLEENQDYLSYIAKKEKLIELIENDEDFDKINALMFMLEFDRRVLDRKENN